MPEFRDSKKVLHAAGEDEDGEFFIRRVSLPRSLVVRGTARKHLTRRYISPSSNKENMPPVLAVKATHPKRRSPLPKWYPRVPLCDITAIAKVMDSIVFLRCEKFNCLKFDCCSTNVEWDV
jgi:hypothetical protein